MNITRPLALVAPVRTISLKDLPSLSGTVFEDIEDFLIKYEGCATTYFWTNADRARYLPLALSGSAASWLDGKQNNT